MRYLLLALALTPALAWPNVELANAALSRTSVEITYDGAYHRIDYPGGDVPDSIGVCTDVIIRSYRAIGTDLQQLVHEDMSASFNAYPNQWGLSQPDSNIDHRRVPNLEAFFTRHGRSLALTQIDENYKPGDIVSWRVGGSLPHIGIVSPQRVPGTNRFYVIHNIGAGPKSEDVLFRYQLHGHYRYAP